MIKLLKKIKLGFNPHNWRIRSKNKNINKNIKIFIKNHSNKIHRRETEFHPEIIIPCFNQGQYLEDAISSISHNNIDITIINDASTDNTLKYIDKLSSSYKFKLINNNKNLNQWGSLNKAIEQSSNNLFIMLNADDCLMRYTINTILDIFYNNSAIYMVGSPHISFDNREDTGRKILKLNDYLPKNLPYKPKYQIIKPEYVLNYKHTNDINMTMSSCSFLKSAWLTVGGFKPFKERVCPHDDRDFQMRVSALFNVAIINDTPLSFL